MAQEYVSVRNLRFLLKEVFRIQELQQYAYFEGYDEQAIDLTVDAAKSLADQYLFPYYREMDKDKAYYKDGVVHVHPAVGKGMRALGEAGWIAALDLPEYGGQQMPYSLLNTGLCIFYSANANLAAHAFLTQGAANLIRTFGAKELSDTFIEPMYAGQWQGTMALTEPQAGSSLSDITSTATPTDDGDYLIKGQKIYISSGDHNAVENVVHLLLARIDGAPAGTKGISLFVVPKKRLENGELVDNHVTTAGIYGKMGQKGYVAAHLMMGEQGDCHGYLVGQPHHGLAYMFKMMNEARIGTGLFATGNASAAYYASLNYALERPQGRHPSNKDLTQPQVLIIEHADVRRMLLFQKAVVEGSFALLLQCSYYSDLARVAPSPKKDNAHLLLELLTPIAKSYPAEMGILSVSAGMQVLGGAGYTDDFVLEQIYRDIRVNSIYEGTTTIHGLDLLGRKIMQSSGKAEAMLIEEIQQTIDAAQQHELLHPWAESLIESVGQFQQVTGHLVQLAVTETPEIFLADASLYLEYVGHIVIAWQWLKQAVVAQNALPQAEGPLADFYRGKVQTCRYFFEYELPKTCGLRERLLSSDRVTLDVTPEELAG
ncbi:MAG: acyl-CoA dehydrogenase C-terminal domain-containing protein [Lewinella sp.]|nr:acyl-CoA dehydrogenase C-terminal domain-containing protein [Lewinella sp.]